MGIYNFDVNLGLDRVIQILDSEIARGTITERIDFHEIHDQGRNKAVVMVYGKKYYRGDSRITLTICLEQSEENKTHVHVIGIGGMERSDINESDTSKKFTNMPRRILEEYIV